MLQLLPDLEHALSEDDETPATDDIVDLVPQMQQTAADLERSLAVVSEGYARALSDEVFKLPPNCRRSLQSAWIATGPRPGVLAAAKSNAEKLHLENPPPDWWNRLQDATDTLVQSRERAKHLHAAANRVLGEPHREVSKQRLKLEKPGGALYELKAVLARLEAEYRKTLREYATDYLGVQAVSEPAAINALLVLLKTSVARPLISPDIDAAIDMEIERTRRTIIRCARILGHADQIDWAVTPAAEDADPPLLESPR